MGLRNLVKAVLRLTVSQKAFDWTKNVEFRVRAIIGAFYEPEAHAVTQLVSKGDLAVDVGANIGQYTVLLSRCVGADGRVVAFEPIPHVRRCLERNLEFFRLRNVAVRGDAVAERDGDVVLFTPLNAGMASFQETALVAHSRTDLEMRSRTVRLDDIGIERCDFIKVDTEGAELAVLSGATRLLARWHPHLMLEVEDSHCRRFGYSPGAIADLLGAFGYRGFIYRRGHFVESSIHDANGNIFFLHPDRMERCSIHPRTSENGTRTAV